MNNLVSVRWLAPFIVPLQGLLGSTRFATGAARGLEGADIGAGVAR
ncbi:MAG: hypothetical protein R3E68_07285 [Burkholderiaceae bacterium]